MSPSTASTADSEGPAWSAAGPGWARYWAGFAAPAREAVARAVGIGAGDAVLDLGCGSGEFCELAAGLGARVCGIDAAASMIELARRRLPEADLRVGPIEQLPWPDDGFDVVTAFNSLQFTADAVGALAEARRVARAGGRVAVCNWGRLEDREAHAIFAPLSELKPPLPGDRPAFDQPGVLERLAADAGLTVEDVAEVDVPFEFPDRVTLERALLGLAPAYGVDTDVARRVVGHTVAEGAAPFRRADGSYRFENRFTYLVSAA